MAVQTDRLADLSEVEGRPSASGYPGYFGLSVVTVDVAIQTEISVACMVDVGLQVGVSVTNVDAAIQTVRKTPAQLKNSRDLNSPSDPLLPRHRNGRKVKSDVDIGMPGTVKKSNLKNAASPSPGPVRLNKRKSKPVQYICPSSDDEEVMSSRKSPSPGLGLPPVKLSITRDKGRKFRVKAEIISPAATTAAAPYEEKKKFKKEPPKPKSFICKTCSAEFPSRMALHSHRKVHITSEKKSFQCQLCDETFIYRSCLKRHQYIHERRFRCKVCDLAFTKRWDLKAHNKVHTGEKTCVCDVCGKGFYTKTLLRRHHYVHSDEKPHICEFCGKGYIGMTQFKTHLRHHTGDRTYACQTCGKNLTDARHLKLHMRIHTGEKPFLCSTCGSSFRKKWHLTVHTRVHTGEKPCICKLCGQGFAQQVSLNLHLAKHKNGKIDTKGSSISYGGSIAEGASSSSASTTTGLDEALKRAMRGGRPTRKRTAPELRLLHHKQDVTNGIDTVCPATFLPLSGTTSAAATSIHSTGGGGAVGTQGSLSSSISTSLEAAQLGTIIVGCRG